MDDTSLQSDIRRTSRTYQRIARFYDFIDLPFEYLRYRQIRPQLFQGLGGRLLDAGVGTGRNMPFYPPGSEVFGVDLSPAMLQRAARRHARTAAKVHLLEMNLAKLQFPDDFFDATVASFVFCTMGSEARSAALRELVRVLSPTGVVRLLEYSPAQTSFRRTVARVWQPWTRWAFGANLAQDIEPELAEASLTVSNSRYVGRSIKLIDAKPRARLA